MITRPCKWCHFHVTAFICSGSRTTKQASALSFERQAFFGDSFKRSIDVQSGSLLDRSQHLSRRRRRVSFIVEYRLCIVATQHWARSRFFHVQYRTVDWYQTSKVHSVEALDIASTQDAPPSDSHHHRHHARCHWEWICLQKGRSSSVILTLGHPWAAYLADVSQFVYDPHLAPLIEALLAAHAQPARRSVAVPAVTSSATTRAASTARRDRGTELRRRRPSREDEAYEGLLRPVSRVMRDEEDPWGRTSAYELKDSIIQRADTSRGHPKTTAPRSPPRPRGHRQPLINLDEAELPTQTHGDVREVIFNAPFTPLRCQSPISPPITRSQSHSRDISDAHTSPARSTTLSPPSVGIPDSTSFSILSLSQRSSPEMPPAMLGSFTLSEADQWATVSQSPHHHRGREEDVLSLPETSTSGYEDAESYSPVVGASSPVEVHTASPGALGLGGVREASAAGGHRETPTVRGAPHARGPTSVVSLSESEGWGGESDWDGLRIESGEVA